MNMKEQIQHSKYAHANHFTMIGNCSSDKPFASVVIKHVKKLTCFFVQVMA
ncbi:Hypothetical protein LOCK908_0751 [Lacticaseibacillus rhamnosus LOCK908]|uniref:Uncharacterized protein n=1 Tax=Lacticaseibacillus rhamnosus (strain LMS2-1) TaxID=525361 RepID=C2K1K9_LACRM|nr:conserved hypothetical protein [Lacticaseibacillus rhamnosus ATCC 8530]AGP73432.1 Hypothetical protein LOCK908_0751 [Lacticaseibacillus rhamnosus LOCK908]EEN78821.1 hypothetical protein HMPREF0539_3044 [Lacticaseibacillus rhamnosus LMS2-1]CAR89591.1 Putative protein without homology [Lacticaseibacillus rhamnosus Lc 705]